MSQTWDTANMYEKSWWGHCQGPHIENEANKQLEYADHMGIPVDHLGHKNICDLGGGPMSLLLQCKYLGCECLVVDPCTYPSWTVERYNCLSISVAQIKAEHFRTVKKFDEAWM